MTRSIAEIITTVAGRCGVTPQQLKGPSHKRVVSTPRHIAMWIVRHETQHSFPVIARHFNRRSHTTIMSAVRLIERERVHDEHLAATLLEMFG